MDDGIHSTGLDCFLALSNAIGIAAAPLEMEQVNLWFIKYAYVAILHLAQLLLDHTLQCNPQTAGLVCDLLYIQRNVTKVTWDIKYLQLVRRDFCHHSSVKKKKKRNSQIPTLFNSETLCWSASSRLCVCVCGLITFNWWWQHKQTTLIVITFWIIYCSNPVCGTLHHIFFHLCTSVCALQTSKKCTKNGFK